MDVVYLDFSKTFNIISHSIFTVKLKKCRLDDWAVRWFEKCLEGRVQRVVVRHNLIRLDSDSVTEYHTFSVT